MTARIRIVNRLHALGAGLAFAGASSSALAAGPEAPVSAGRLLQLGLGLVVVLVLIGATAFALRRVLRIDTAGSGPLRIVAGLSMGTRERLVLVDADGCRLLIGVVPGRIQTLHVLGDAPRTPSSAAHDGEAPGAGESFSRLLRSAEGGTGRGA